MSGHGPSKAADYKRLRETPVMVDCGLKINAVFQAGTL